MTTNKTISNLKKKLVPILKRNDVVKASLFGSYARGDKKKTSDIDILVKFKGKKTLFDVTHLELELEAKLGKKVDLLTYNAVHPLLRKQIREEEVAVL